MSDKSETKSAVIVFSVVILAAIVLPFAILTNGVRPAPVRAIDTESTPRELVTTVCMRAALVKDPSAVWMKPADWILSKRESGNYKLWMMWDGVTERGNRLHTLAVCTVQPVDGSMQVVSVS